MFNLDTNALQEQLAAKSTAEKKAFRDYAAEYFGLMYSGCDVSGISIDDLYDRMLADPNISVQTFVAFFLASN